MKKVLVLIAFVLIFVTNTMVAGAVSEIPNLGTMLDEHGAVLLLIDPESGNIMYANAAAAAFYGYSKEQLQSMKITQINMLTAEETSQEMQAAYEENRNYFVFRHRLSSDEIRTVEVFSYPVKYGDKEALFSVIHDITDKMLLQEKENRLIAGILVAGAAVIATLALLLLVLLKRRRSIRTANQEIENYSRLIETFINADKSLIYLKDENLNYVFANNAFQAFYNKNSKEIVGLDDFALSGTEFADMRRQTDQAVLDKQTLIHDEVVWKGRIYNTTKFPVKMPNSSFGVGAYIRDVTEDIEQKKHLEKVLERNNILVDVFSLSFQNNQEQLDYVLHRALNLTESKYGYIYYYDEETREFELNSWTEGVIAECSVQEPKTRYHLDKTGIWGEVVRQRKPIIANNFKDPNPLKKGYPKGHVELDKFMSVPIIIDEKIVAVVGIGNKQDEYDDNDVVNITILMSGAWQAIQRREALEQLAYERNKYLQTLISIGDGVMVLDKDGMIEMLNDVAQKLTGWTGSEACGKHYKEVFVLSSEYPGKEVADPIEGVFKSNEIQELGDNVILTSRTGAKYNLEDSAAPVFNEYGKNVGAVLVFRDATEKKEQIRRIEYLSFHDNLTGLYNRSYIEEALIRIDTERNLPITIVMGDVNALKLTNDVFGHSYGDIMLKNIAEVLRLNGRTDDIIARWGGDEFVSILPKTDRITAEKIVSIIKNEFSNRHVKAIRGSISMGIASKVNSSESISEILDKAEGNMYLQKTLERDSIKDEEIKTIITMLHKNSQGEQAHSQHVLELCEMLGKALYLPEMEIRILKEAGYLHDIGKIVLERELIDLDRRLTDEEKREVKKHPVVGFRILNSFDKTLDLAEAVLAHHENWDGSGYPKGLKKEEIPLPARIIAITECYDRIMQRAGADQVLGKHRAVEYLENSAGTKFDPDIIAVFLQLLESKE